jgi:hypothetical protein
LAGARIEHGGGVSFELPYKEIEAEMGTVRIIVLYG